jgi:predicted HTH transcriptional regulator
VFEQIAEIRARLSAGEGALSEFKELRIEQGTFTAPDAESFAGEMVAFANADGGVLFLGVTDSGAVQGLPDDTVGRVESWVVNIATSNCDPPIRPVIRRLRLPDPSGTPKAVLLCEVKKSLYVHRTAGGRWYVRVGSQKRDMTAQELSRLLQQRGRSYVFDEQAVMTATLEDLDRPALQRHFAAPVAIPQLDLLRNTKIVTRDEPDVDRPTVAGLLAFGHDMRDHLPSAYIEAAVYRGSRLDSEYLNHAQSIEGSAPQQIDRAVAFVDRLMLRPARKPSGRIDYPQYSLGVVREAIVNAVAHRDYSLSGAKIRLYLFDDRLELYSPGSLPNTLTLESMPFRVFTRNQLLVSFLSKMRSATTGLAYLESRGEGVRRILEEGESFSGRRPEYRLLDGQELLLRLWGARPPARHESFGKTR